MPSNLSEVTVYPNQIDCRFFDTYDITKLDSIRYPCYLMENQHKILFYGNSLVLAGVQETFKSYPGFETIGLDQLTTQEDLLTLKPSVVVFDMGDLESEFLIAQMQQLPGLLLIGVDRESHEVLLTGQATCLISLEQITQIVRNLVAPRVEDPASSTAQET
jgi:hypothetical protein